jgi:hypothetical protein
MAPGNATGTPKASGNIAKADLPEEDHAQLTI